MSRIQRNKSSKSCRVVRHKTGESSPTRYYSHKQESEVALEVGGRVQLNSGATPFEKGDVSSADWLIECKTKTSPSQSISIKKEWLDKNRSESLYMGKKYNALAFSFGEGQENYYIIDSNTMQDFLILLNSQKILDK